MDTTPSTRAPSSTDSRRRQVLHRCCMCVSEHRRRSDLLKHVMATHLVHVFQPVAFLPEFPHECLSCYRKFASRRALRDHQLARYPDAAAVHQCPECEFAAPSQSALRKHLVVHRPGERDFVCSHCSKRFALRGYLINHMRIHVRQQERFRCSDCGFQCRNETVLEIHRKTHGDKCDLCEKSYKYAVDLRRHRLSHEGVQLFTCCEKNFLTEKSLKAHQRGHNVERNFKCPDCDRKFTTDSLLRSHLKSRHNRED